MQVVIPDAKPGGWPRSVDLREVVNAMPYPNRAGCQWDTLPHDLPVMGTVCEHLAAWRGDGTWQATLDVLREAYRENHARSGEPTPSAGASTTRRSRGPRSGASGGTTGAKKIRGRKRHIGVDTIGLLLAVAAAGAGVDDARAALRVLERLDGVRCPRLEVVWADSRYHNHDLNAWKAGRPDLGWRLEVVSRPPAAKGVVLVPKRWVVERTFARLGRARRLSRDDERHTASGECMVRIQGIQLLLNRMAPKNCYLDWCRF